MNFNNNTTICQGNIDEVLDKYHLGNQDIINNFKELTNETR